MDFVEQLKSSVDIVKVIGEYVRLRRTGATGRYLGLCPFHQEKTPSFNVNQARQFYKCFGCGVAGDVLKFVMEIEGLTFPETLKLIAERNGVPMPKRNEYNDPESKLKSALFDMHAAAAAAFQANLKSPQGGEARAYLAKRGISAELIDAFGLGYSDPSGQALVRTFSGYSPEQLEASGLVRRRQEGSGMYDVFRGRLMFPIHNESGKVIAFGGRALREDDQPKYLNSPETPIYRKTFVLYNLHRAREAMRRTGRAVLVEGYMDVIGVWAAGVHEVVASCGTALTNTQVRALHRHSDLVVVNFDPDNAGANAAERAIQIFLDEGMHVRVVSLEGGLDPDEYAKEHGAEVYKAKLDNASGYFHWLADRARAKFDMRSAEGRMDAYKFLLPSVSKIPDKLERAAVAGDVAAYLGVEPSLVLDQFRKAATDRQAQPAKQRQASIPALEQILLRAWLAGGAIAEQVRFGLGPEMTAGFLTREIFDALRRDSLQDRQLSEPSAFAALESQLSESGKSLLHQVMAADQIEEEESLLEQANACLRRLESDSKKRRVDAIRTAIRSAEREGRLEEAFRLMSDLSTMEQQGRSAV